MALTHRSADDKAKSAAFTKDKVTVVADAYLSRPFDLEAHIRHYERVRDSEDITQATRRIYALGAERVAVYQNRMVEIQAKTRSAPNPTEFLEINITRQEQGLTNFLKTNKVIPPGSPLAKQYSEMLLELELWLRVEKMMAEQSPIEPYPQDPESIRP